METGVLCVKFDSDNITQSFNNPCCLWSCRLLNTYNGKYNAMHYILTLKAPITTAADNIFFIYFFFYFSEKTSLDISCELSAWQTIHMKCQDLFSLKNKKKNLECYLLQILLVTLRVKVLRYMQMETLIIFCHISEGDNFCRQEPCLPCK